MRDSAKDILDKEYGIRALSLREMPSGWSACAWKVHSVRGDYFLKVYDKNRPSTESWVARIDSYMPVLLWLHGNTGLRQKISAPILTKDGSYKSESADFLYMVFPFIDGQTICEARITPEQVRELALIVAQLHEFAAEIPVPTDALIETFDLSFCDALSGWLESEPDSARLNQALAPHADAIHQTISDLQAAATALGKSEIHHALCHTDIHGWNLIQSDRLMLIDWEGITLSPVEADLFSFTETFFFEYAWDEFMSVYRSVHGGYRVNPDAMLFYRFRRRLDDIHAFAESILYDGLSDDEADQSIRYLKRECELLNAMRRPLF